MNDIDNLKYQAAAAAMAEIADGMRIGLGTGSTAKHFVDLLGARVADGLDCLCVATSEVTAEQARSLGIPLTDLDAHPNLDVAVDGADEIGPDRVLIKGGGGALLREKIVAGASGRMVVIADASKKVDHLGAFPLPIEVNVFGLAATYAKLAKILEEYGGTGGLSIRERPDGKPFVTDGGHLIVDASFGRISEAEALSASLLDVPGVVQHGLFLDMCSIAYVATAEGVETFGH